MQALLVDLFPWVVALYLADGLAQLGRGHLLLVGAAWGRFRVRRAGLHLVALSPLDEVVAAHDLPFLVSPRRVFLFDPRRRTEPALVAEADLEPVARGELVPVEREGRKVRAGGRVAVAAPTAGWAERIRADLAALADPAATGAPADRSDPRAVGARPDRSDPGLAAAPPDSGPGPAAAHPDRIDLAAARALRARQLRWVPALRAAAGLLFAGTFLTWPAAAFAPQAAPIAPGPLLALLGALVLTVAGLTFGMLRACGEPVARALGAALHLAVYPVAALRPLAHGPRSLYRRFDAMTLAAALLPPEDLRTLAGRELRRARLSRAATPPELAAFWDERARGLVALLLAAGISEAEALAPPARAGEAAAWCPLCGAQYRAGFAACADCGVAAEPFAP